MLGPYCISSSTYWLGYGRSHYDSLRVGELSLEGSVFHHNYDKVPYAGLDGVGFIKRGFFGFFWIKPNPHFWGMGFLVFFFFKFDRKFEFSAYFRVSPVAGGRVCVCSCPAAKVE